MIVEMYRIDDIEIDADIIARVMEKRREKNLAVASEDIDDIYCAPECTPDKSSAPKDSPFMQSMYTQIAQTYLSSDKNNAPRHTSSRGYMQIGDIEIF